jgi:transcriptional regulator with XRE-family HTH domain
MAQTLQAYIATMIELLHELGVSQRDLGRHFGVSEQMVSRWARGVAALTPARFEEFLAFVQAQQQAALERAKAQPRPAPGGSVLTGPQPTPEEALQRRINHYWSRWHDEISERNGQVYEDLIRQLQVLRPYLGMDTDKLREVLNTPPTARQARTALLSAAKALAREVSRLERMRPLDEGKA